MIRSLRRNFDAVDVFYGLLPEVSAYAAFITWASLVVRAIRGEDAKENWRPFVSAVAFISTRALIRSGRVRQAQALRSAVVQLHAAQRGAAADARQRDQRAAELQEGLNRLTTTLVVLAALTLGASIVAVVIAVIGT